MRISIKDVAEKAGLSRMSVWRALNGKDQEKVSPATRDRIQKAIEELNYSPSEVLTKVNLPPRSKKKITILAPSDENSMSAQELKRHQWFTDLVMKEAVKRKYALEIIPISTANSSTNISWELLDDIGPGSLVLANDTWYMFALMELARRGAKVAAIMPNVFWLDVFKPQMADWSLFIYDIGGRALADYYLSLGCTRIARTAWSKYMNEPNYPAICEYDEVMTDRNIEYRHIIPLPEGSGFAETIREAYRQKPFDALIFNLGYEPESLREQLGLAEHIRLGSAFSYQPANLKGSIDHIVFDWPQIISDAVDALTAESFAPNRKFYQGQLVPISTHKS